MRICTEEADLERADVQALLQLHFDAMRSQSPPDACHVLALDSLRQPSLTLVSAREDGRLLGVGALKEIGPAHGEIKSMRTAPDALGQGVGRAILDHLIQLSRHRGYTRLSLETGGTAEFLPAIRLYEQAGFMPGPPFGGYPPSPFTRFLTLELAPALHPPNAPANGPATRLGRAVS